MLFWTVLFRTKSCLFYDHILWLIRPTMPLRHRRSALRLFGSYRWRGTKGAPWRRMTRENHAANPPSMARHYTARKNKVSLPCLTRQSVRTYSDMFCEKKNPRRDFKKPILRGIGGAAQPFAKANGAGRRNPGKPVTRGMDGRIR